MTRLAAVLKNNPDSASVAPPKRNRRTIVIFSMLVFVVYGIGSAFELIVTMDVCFHYVFAYFICLTVVVPIFKTGRFGAGVAVYLPYAILGPFAVYYAEWVLTQALLTPWTAALWGVFGLCTGFSADLAFRYIPERILGKWRGILVGVVFGFADFCFTLLSLTVVYMDPVPGTLHFLHGVGLLLPFLLTSAGFAGYTASCLVASR